MSTAQIIAGTILMILPVIPALAIPRKEWDVKCWFVSGGALWLLFLAVIATDFVRYLFS